jgi:hypothetical protein
MHADATPEQIIAAVREAWAKLEPYFEVTPSRDEYPDVEVEKIEAEYRAVLRELRGPKAIISCYLPLEVETFLRLVERTVISQRLGRWDFELFGRRLARISLGELDDEQRAAIGEHGLWMCVGRYNDKHELWVPLERGEVGYGRVYDFCDGSPMLTGPLVPDREYPTFLEFLIKITPD